MYTIAERIQSPSYWVFFLGWLVVIASPFTSRAQSVDWLVTGGDLRTNSSSLFLLPRGNALSLSLLPIPPDSPFATLQIEMGVELSQWRPDTSQVFLIIGTDSVGVLRLWGAGYDDEHQALVWGKVTAPQPGAGLQIEPSQRKAVTIVPIQRSLYFKWVITPESSTVEINGVPMTLTAAILPWHVTYIGIAAKGCQVGFQRPKVLQIP